MLWGFLWWQKWWYLIELLKSKRLRVTCTIGLLYYAEIWSQLTGYFIEEEWIHFECQYLPLGSLTSKCFWAYSQEWASLQWLKARQHSHRIRLVIEWKHKQVNREHLCKHWLTPHRLRSGFLVAQPQNKPAHWAKIHLILWGQLILLQPESVMFEED